jgi:hypothetical protein
MSRFEPAGSAIAGETAMSSTQYPIIDPFSSNTASELAQALIEHRDDPKAWVWTPYTDWKSDECRNIRYEIAGLMPDYHVKFRAAVHEGRRGTAMHMVPKGEDDLHTNGTITDVPF